MKPDTLNDQLFEVMIENAMHENWQKYMASLSSDEELKSSEAYEPSKQFNEKIKKLIAKSRRREKIHHLPAVVKRIAAVFIFVLGLISFSLITIPPMYATIKEVTMNWFPQYTSYEYSAKAADIKDVKWGFAYIPKGYKLSTIHFSDDMVDWEYTNYEKDELLLIFSQKAAGETIGVDNEHSEYSQIELNGVKAELYASNDKESPSYLIWAQEGYSFTIMSYLDKNELIKIARSVESKE